MYTKESSLAIGVEHAVDRETAVGYLRHLEPEAQLTPDQSLRAYRRTTRLGSAKAFFISVVATPIIRDVFRSYNVVDRPGMRKVHRHPIPRVGGVAIALAYVSSEAPELSYWLDFSTTSSI